MLTLNKKASQILLCFLHTKHNYLQRLLGLPVGLKGIMNSLFYEQQ